MKINISNLSEGVHEYAFEEKPSTIELDERFSTPVTVKVQIEKRRRQLFLTGQARTSGRFVCDRCLDSFSRDFAVDYRMAYVYDSAGAEPADRTGSAGAGDELTVIHSSTNEIDIAEDVRQYILLSVPLKLVCKEDCAGLCSACGANLNHVTCGCPKQEIDPRWDGLKKIINKN